MIAVKDVNAAAKFYEGTLGLTRQSTQGEEVITYRSGKRRIECLPFAVRRHQQGDRGGLERGRRDRHNRRCLKSKGVAFEHYDMPGLTLQGDVHVGGDMKVAWFKDPDGNILSVVSGLIEAHAAMTAGSRRK